MTLQYVTLLRERALLNKARARYKSRHSDHKEEFASAKRSQMHKCPPRVYSLAGICASACDAEHLQIRRSVIWAASPNSKEEPRACSCVDVFAFETNAKHSQIRRNVIWAASPNSKEEPRVYSGASICASACDAKHLQIQRSVIWAASPSPKESHMDSKTASGQTSTQLPGVMKR